MQILRFLLKQQKGDKPEWRETKDVWGREVPQLTGIRAGIDQGNYVEPTRTPSLLKSQLDFYNFGPPLVSTQIFASFAAFCANSLRFLL